MDWNGYKCNTFCKHTQLVKTTWKDWNMGALAFFKGCQIRLTLLGSGPLKCHRTLKFVLNLWHDEKQCNEIPRKHDTNLALTGPFKAKYMKHPLKQYCDSARICALTLSIKCISSTSYDRYMLSVTFQTMFNKFWSFIYNIFFLVGSHIL